MESWGGWPWQGDEGLTFHNMLCNADTKLLLLAEQQAWGWKEDQKACLGT